MSIKLVVLDWAGTAVDYGCFAPVGAFDKAFRECGIEPTVDEIRAPMGMLKREHIRTMLDMPRLKAQWVRLYTDAPDDAAVERVYSCFERSLMTSLSDYAALKPDTLDAVARLCSMGLHIGSTTGYTDAMMEVVVRRAAQQGYAPDAWFSPDAVGGLGRPYPYMIYENMRRFEIASVDEVVKVGDTVADIREGKQAGVRSLGVLEGSSVMGLSQEEYGALTPDERAAALADARDRLMNAGADGVLTNLSELPGWIERCE